MICREYCIEIQANKFLIRASVAKGTIDKSMLGLVCEWPLLVFLDLLFGNEALGYNGDILTTQL